MLVEDLHQSMPKDWLPIDTSVARFNIVEVSPLTEEYQNILLKVLGNYYICITGIYRVQNPDIYSKYLLKSYECGLKDPYEIMTLFHDTPMENPETIASSNFDWRYGGQYMYGPGVCFSVSPSLANQHSYRINSIHRSMFVTDVLVQNVQHIQGEIYLPDFGYDTVVADNVRYIKYFDCEYYPRYFVDYISLY